MSFKLILRDDSNTLSFYRWQRISKLAHFGSAMLFPSVYGERMRAPTAECCIIVARWRRCYDVACVCSEFNSDLTRSRSGSRETVTVNLKFYAIAVLATKLRAFLKPTGERKSPERLLNIVTANGIP